MPGSVGSSDLAREPLQPGSDVYTVKKRAVVIHRVSGD
jgi:hypothetical protein